ncbi:unnamed protein product, partial [Closterium sp. NIES-54]
RSNSNGRSSSSGNGSCTGGRSCSSGGFSCSACSNLHSGALADPASTHTGASEVLSVGPADTTRLVPAFVAGSGATSPTAWLSFTLDSGASSCFFRDCINLTPLHTPITVALADPSVGSVVAESTTTLPCPTAPSGFLTGYYTPSFSRNLVGVSHLHDLGVVTTFPLHEPDASCTVGATRAPLAIFHREPGSGLSPRVACPASSLACAAVHSLRQGSAVRCPSLLVPSHHDSLTDPTLGRLGPLPGPWPTDARPWVTLIFIWTGFPGVTANYRAWGCLAHVRAPGANTLSARTRASVFLGFPLDTSGWVYYDPVTHQFFASQDVTFDESVSYYRSRPHRGFEAFSPQVFLSSPPPPIAPVAPPPSRPAPSSVSHVTPQSYPLQRLVPEVSGDAGGAVAKGEGNGAAGAHVTNSGGAGDVRVETTPEENTA